MTELFTPLGITVERSNLKKNKLQFNLSTTISGWTGVRLSPMDIAKIGQKQEPSYAAMGDDDNVIYVNPNKKW